MSQVEIDVAIGCDGWPDEASLLMIAQTAFSTTLDVLELDERFNVSLLFTSDAAIQTLNREWRGKNKPTNVLSFPGGDSPVETEVEFLGDIAFGLETVKREAIDEGKVFDHHVTHLLVHGFLHLCGYDHETGEDDAEEMETLERAILARLAIADPYAIDDV
ncbi:MAG: rRNA maturation RNase YbeY [Notoacmeibacter sp.]